MSIPDISTLLQELIAAPSVSSAVPSLDQSNAQVIHLIANWLEDLGFTVELQQPPHNLEKFNLIASRGQGPDGLVLAGHTDTVPYDSPAWSSDPLQLTERDGRLYGLGVSDMKSFFAFVVEAVRSLDLERIQRPLVIIGTADEESSMRGAQALVASGRKFGRHVLIGEPTNMQPIRMHKGITMEAVRLRGRSAHSSNPALGNNALEGMYLVLGELLRWRTELQANYHNSAFHVPVPTMNFGRIQGGDSPNRICDYCELHLDIRPLPGMSLDELRLELERRLRKVLADTVLELEIAHLFDGIAAMETSATAPIVQVTEELTGCTAGAVAFGTEAPYFTAMGMQTVILGPGSIDQAHQPNEFLAIERIEPYVQLLKKLIQRFCFTA